jgi:hypothetical protein
MREGSPSALTLDRAGEAYIFSFNEIKARAERARRARKDKNQIGLAVN